VDIDIVVSAAHVQRLERIANELGFTQEALPMSLAGGAIEVVRVSKPDEEARDLLLLALVVVTPTLQGVWEGREVADWDGVPLVVVSREGLIAMKKLRGSEQDRADIRRLEERYDAG
jgi:hypothetical protein